MKKDVSVPLFSVARAAVSIYKGNSWRAPHQQQREVWNSHKVGPCAKYHDHKANNTQSQSASRHVGDRFARSCEGFGKAVERLRVVIGRHAKKRWRVVVAPGSNRRATRSAWCTRIDSSKVMRVNPHFMTRTSSSSSSHDGHVALVAVRVQVLSHVNY